MKVNELTKSCDLVTTLTQAYDAEIVDGIITFPPIKSKDEYIEYGFMIFCDNKVSNDPCVFDNKVSNDPCVFDNEIPEASHVFDNEIPEASHVFDNEVWVLQIDFRKDSRGHTSFIRGGWNYVVETFEELYYSIGYTFKYLAKQ